MHPDNKIVSFVVITESYRRFHTHFIRGVKVRLFCSPQCAVATFGTDGELCDKLPLNPIESWEISSPHQHEYMMIVYIHYRISGIRTEDTTVLVAFAPTIPTATKMIYHLTMKRSVYVSRRQLIPIFDKSAFSRFSQLFQPRFVVHNFMLPKRRFWTAEQTFGNAFSKHFSHT